MSKILVLIALAFGLYALNAFAQQMTENSNDPCKRGSTHVQISGMDQDVQKCYNSMLNTALAKANMQVIGLQAELTIMNQDLNKANNDARSTEEIRKLLDWYKNYALGADAQIEELRKK